MDALRWLPGGAFAMFLMLAHHLNYAHVENAVSFTAHSGSILANHQMPTYIGALERRLGKGRAAGWRGSQTCCTTVFAMMVCTLGNTLRAMTGTGIHPSVPGLPLK